MDIQNILKNIKLYRVQSSNIFAIGYDPKNYILAIIFNNNSQYIYFNVPNNVWNYFSSSDSKGKTFKDVIKNKYKFIKLR